MAKLAHAFLLPREQPLGTKVVVSLLRGIAPDGKSLYSVKDLKSRRVLFYASELRLANASISTNGQIRGELRHPMTATEYMRWSLEVIFPAAIFADFLYLRDGEVHRAVPLQHD